MVKISGLLPVMMLLTFISCKDQRPDSKTYKIGVATFMHETCTFCPKETGIEEFEFYGPPLEGEEVLSSGEYIKGFVSASNDICGFKLVGLKSPRDAKGGSSGSWITREAFDKYTNGIAESIKANGPLDAIFLSLHGGMAVTGIPKPEAEIVRRVREAAGEAPIFVTLDLHANEDHELTDIADAVLIVKRYPHYDSFLQGERAARLLYKTLKGDYKPVMATRKPGIITPSVFQGTGVSPAMEIMEKARRWEEHYPGVFVSVAFGFAYADVPDVGATVMVITNNDRKLADEIADNMNDFIWRNRREFAGKKLPKTKEGVALSVQAARAGKTPVIVADHADRTGNSTHIFEELLKQGAENFCIATISDYKAIDQISQKGLKDGDVAEIKLGGYEDEYAGNPVPVRGKIIFLGEYRHFKKLAVLKLERNNYVIITPVLHEVTSPEIFKDLNINIDDLDIIVLKSRVHFRRGFYENGLAGEIFEVDAPGLGPSDLSTINYKNIPKDLYPIYKKD
jgi:microcystin degradation protein MlrC